MELDNTLEEGELSNDSDGYTPLERPATYSSLAKPFAPKKEESESDPSASASSSGSDSDSDSPGFRAKKPKMKVKKALPKPLGSKKRKYDVWSNRAQEDSLLAINSCDVSHKDRSRDVESYDPSIARLRMNSKRSRADRQDAHLRPMSRKDVDDVKSVKGHARMLMDIVKGEKTNDEVAVEIANKLCEEKEELILRIVNAIGADKAIQIYLDVKRIELEGGMLIMNQTRRRTPGGVYLFLIKHDDELTKEQHAIIFEDEKRQFKEYVKSQKKKKTERMKQKIAESTARSLPELLTKAELVHKLSDKQWTPKDNEEDVVNPPPTPETDGHVDSGDTETVEDANSGSACARAEKYENDFLDLNVGNDMDMF